MSERPRWVCCQLGAREHYAAPRALHRHGELAALVTDAWAAPGSPWTRVPGDTGRRLSERYSGDLSTADIRDATASLVLHEASWRLTGLTGWPLVMVRNQWFQERAASAIAALSGSVVFAHSYSALAILQRARALGRTTVLGQIDPGESHTNVLREVAARWPEFGAALPEPPAEYYASWREECHLADRIVVNSEWARESLERAGIDVSKVRVIPLPFDADGDASFQRVYPEAFSAGRPLRVLFVGSVAAFKGVPSILESLDHLGDAPVELTLVGPIAAAIPPRYRADRRVRFAGAVSRSEVMDYYRGADVLIFPSHSDGFGMAQVEARGWRLPIIASRSCGRIVDDGVNGRLLPEVSAEAIASAIREAMTPGVLARWSCSPASSASSLDAFGAALLELVSHG